MLGPHGIASLGGALLEATQIVPLWHLLDCANPRLPKPRVVVLKLAEQLVIILPCHTAGQLTRVPLLRGVAAPEVTLVAQFVIKAVQVHHDESTVLCGVEATRAPFRDLARPVLMPAFRFKVVNSRREGRHREELWLTVCASTFMVMHFFAVLGWTRTLPCLTVLTLIKDAACVVFFSP